MPLKYFSYGIALRHILTLGLIVIFYFQNHFIIPYKKSEAAQTFKKTHFTYLKLVNYY